MDPTRDGQDFGGIVLPMPLNRGLPLGLWGPQMEGHILVAPITRATEVLILDYLLSDPHIMFVYFTS